MRSEASLRVIAAVAVLVFVASCSSVPRHSPTRDDQGAVIALIATQLIGTRYQFGGADRDGFDCSGLAVYAHEGVGLQIPRTAADQNRSSRPVPLTELQPGDLLFFRIGARRVNHVGIYAGDGRFVHAPRRGEVVSYASLDDPYYRQRLVGAGRFWSRDGARAVAASRH